MITKPDSRVVFKSVNEYDQTLVDEAVEQLFQALPCTARLNEQKKVLLKPNLLAKHPPEHAVTTHPAVVTAVIRALKRRGVPAENIVCADSMGGVYNSVLMKSVYAVSGIGPACEAEGVECYTECKWEKVPVEGGVAAQKFSLICPVLEADFIIDLPKMKTHVMAGCTAAVKNLFGCIPGLQKAEWHTRYPDRERFGEMLVDLLLTVRPDMAVLDAVVAMEGDGPAGGEPRAVGLLAAAEDLPALDLALCHMMGLEPMRVPYLEAAHRRGLCGKSFDPACLEGDKELFQVIPGYKLPSSYMRGNGSVDFADHKPMLAPLLRWLEAKAAPRPVIDRKKCIGCGKCAEICPQHTILLEQTKAGRKARVKAANCIRCFCCHEMCPVKAIDVRQLALFRM